MPEPTQPALQEKLLAAIDELIAAYESAVAEAPVAERADDVADGVTGDVYEVTDKVADEVTVAAGPFTSFADLREFERALSEIPGVTEVHTRGYEGADRAIIEVRLASRAEPPPSEATQ